MLRILFLFCLPNIFRTEVLPVFLINTWHWKLITRIVVRSHISPSVEKCIHAEILHTLSFDSPIYKEWQKLRTDLPNLNKEYIQLLSVSLLKTGIFLRDCQLILLYCRFLYTVIKDSRKFTFFLSAALVLCLLKFTEGAKIHIMCLSALPW